MERYLKLDQAKNLYCLAICLAIFVQLTGCSVSPPGQPEKQTSLGTTGGTPRFGGIYRRPFSSPILTLEPREIGESFSHTVCRQIFDGLVEFDNEGSPIPDIAATWTFSPDRLSCTFKLRSDCRFHATFGPQNSPTKNGGRIVTAEDVEYTIKRLLDPKMAIKRGKNFWVIRGAQAFSEGKSDTIEGMKVLSSDTVSFLLEKPFAPFPSLLALSNAFIVPREDVEALKAGFASSPVGCGPFIWTGSTEDKITVEANKDYFRGKPYLNGIEFLTIRDEMERFRRFQKRELSETDVPDMEYKNVKSDPKLGPLFQEVSRWGIQYLGMNVEIPPFENVKVRQAINFGIDSETIVKLILNDRAKVAHGVLPPGIAAFNPSLTGYPFDPQKARKLLAEAGYPDGKGFPEIVLQINRDSIHSRIGEFILANLRDLGIKCVLKEVEFAEHLPAVERGDLAFFRMGWLADFPDPDNFLYELFHSSNAGPEGNFSRYRNPEVDELLENARFEVDQKERTRLYRKAEEMIVRDAPWVFIYHNTTHILCQPEVREMTLTPMGPPFIAYRKIWFESQ